MGREGNAKFSVAIAITILSLWAITFCLKDYGVGCVSAVIATGATMVGLQKILG